MWSTIRSRTVCRAHALTAKAVCCKRDEQLHKAFRDALPAASRRFRSAPSRRFSKIIAAGVLSPTTLQGYTVPSCNTKTPPECQT